MSRASVLIRLIFRTLLLLLILNCVLSGEAKDADEPIELKAGPHLFLDDHLIESSSNVVRLVRQPRRDPSIRNPIITGPEDKNFQPYFSVVRDSSNGFRIWYGARTEDNNAMRSRLGYMESRDGIQWQRPHRILEVPGPIQFGASIIDEGTAFQPATQRYKYGWYLDSGLKIAVSHDGLKWTALSSDVVAKHSHDINGIYRDPIRNHYLAMLSFYETGSGYQGQRRLTRQVTSTNLLDWSEPTPVLTPDARDEGETQFYAMDGFLARGDLLIGMVKVLRDDLKADHPPIPRDAYGIGYTTLAWTRDGKTWTRDREKFFDRNLSPEAWDHSHAWIDEQVLAGTNVFLYYGGYRRGHKVNRFEERQIGLVMMSRDRYVARAAEGGIGRLRTRLLRWSGTAIALNADANGGVIRAQVVDAAGSPIPGFGFTDCEAIRGDHMTQPLRWKTPLTKLVGKTVRLDFAIENAALYAMEIW